MRPCWTVPAGRGATGEPGAALPPLPKLCQLTQQKLAPTALHFGEDLRRRLSVPRGILSFRKQPEVLPAAVLGGGPAPRPFFLPLEGVAMEWRGHQGTECPRGPGRTEGLPPSVAPLAAHRFLSSTQRARWAGPCHMCGLRWPGGRPAVSLFGLFLSQLIWGKETERTEKQKCPHSVRRNLRYQCQGRSRPKMTNRSSPHEKILPFITSFESSTHWLSTFHKLCSI